MDGCCKERHHQRLFQLTMAVLFAPLPAAAARLLAGVQGVNNALAIRLSAVLTYFAAVVMSARQNQLRATS